MSSKPKVATCSLAGCFGCHMSFLDIDERIAQLAELVQFDRSPITDIKNCGPCDIGLIEGGLCNEENLEVLLEFRKNCKVLIAVGACAATGGIPSMRNNVPLAECMEEAYISGTGVVSPKIPNDPELPPLLDKVRPISEAVDIDYVLPGCPPSADAIWHCLSDLLAGREPRLDYQELRYE